MSNGLRLALCIVVPQCVGIAAGISTVSGVREWYPTLVKPSFTPPAWVFGPVWTVLYFMMGVAAYLVWRKGWSHPGVKLALAAFVVQLAVNGLWSFLFFGFRSPGLALVEIGLLWIAVAVTVVVFYSQSKLAGGLLLPYWAWVSFAAVLNYAFWRLNP